MSLNIDTITFGKYKNKTITDMLKDRNYCLWFIKQLDMKDKYVYIYNRVCEYQPKFYFLPNIIFTYSNFSDFLKDFPYFNLKSSKDLQIELSENYLISYKFYKKIIKDIKKKLENRFNNGEDNPFDIKAPSKWLNIYETETKLNRDVFKAFITENDLDNITTIIETIKKYGGIEYKGAKSFIISKNNSIKQELYWENILKSKYNEEISVQFQYEKCFFDFININKNIIYECKLGIKDFNKLQYDKYILTLNKYKIIYLIGYDTIINIDNKKIYIVGSIAYDKYIIDKNKKTKTKNSLMLTMINDFDIEIIDNINNFI